MTDLFLLYSTFPQRSEAIFAAKALLAQRLVACVNIVGGVTSLFHWEGELKEEPEVLLLAKTTGKDLDAAMGCIRQNHPYELPCIVAYNAQQASPEFMKWVMQETL